MACRIGKTKRIILETPDASFRLRKHPSPDAGFRWRGPFPWSPILRPGPSKEKLPFPRMAGSSRRQSRARVYERRQLHPGTARPRRIVDREGKRRENDRHSADVIHDLFDDLSRCELAAFRSDPDA